MVRHSGRYEFHYCALCREFSHRQLFAKIPSLRLVLGIVFVRTLLKIHDNRSASEQRPIKNWRFPFCNNRAITANQKCVCFTNPVPPSITRKYHPKVLERLHLLNCIAACLQRTLPWYLFLLALISIPIWSQAAENWSSACWSPCWDVGSSKQIVHIKQRLIM